MEILRQHPHYRLAESICKKLLDAGHIAWLAGGCVRDGLLNKVPKDLDVATDALPDKIQSLFSKTLDVGKKFGTIIIVENQIQIEVTTFRKDGPYLDGRHPESVTFSSPKEDAARRDFTINAMFYDPFSQVIHDYFGGRDDLKNQVIRTVGLPQERFDEDKLRMLRAIRFAAVTGFKIEDKTFKEIKRRPNDIKQVSMERVHQELKKLLDGAHRGEGLKLLRDSGLGALIFPNVKLTDALVNEASRLNGFVPLMTWILFKGAHSLAVAEDILRQLKISNRERDVVLSSIKNLRKISNLKDVDIYKLAASESGHVVAAIGDLVFFNEEKIKQLKLLIQNHYRLPSPFINGDDLKTLGIKPGALMGKILDTLYEEQILGRIENKPQAVDFCNKLITQLSKT